MGHYDAANVAHKTGKLPMPVAAGVESIRSLQAPYPANPQYSTVQDAGASSSHRHVPLIAIALDVLTHSGEDYLYRR